MFIVNREECEMTIATLSSLPFMYNDIKNLIVKQMTQPLYHKYWKFSEPVWIESDFTRDDVCHLFLDLYPHRIVSFDYIFDGEEVTREFYDEQFLEECSRAEAGTIVEGLVDVRINDERGPHIIWYVVDLGVFYAFLDSMFEFDSNVSGLTGNALDLPGFGEPS